VAIQDETVSISAKQCEKDVGVDIHIRGVRDVLGRLVAGGCPVVGRIHKTSCG
jgi:hypothetical protein